MKILITGVAGFIGYHLTKQLLNERYEIVGIDNINDYYSTDLKKDRLSLLEGQPNYKFINLDLKNREAINDLFVNERFDIVINLAAQAGVRYSIENPHAYLDSNIIGFTNILESSAKNDIKHLIYASSSSVYGANKKIPFSEEDLVDSPVSLYAATKKANELLAHSYSSIYKLPTTGLRFFTVYGPWGRPDMAYFSFVDNIVKDKKIKVFNNGDMYRDFTYIDDIVLGISKLVKKVGNKTINQGEIPYDIFNIGNNNPEKLMDFINILEELLQKKAKIEYLPMQKGDVKATYASIDKLYNSVGFKPSTSLKDGLSNFVEWYLSYYGKNESDY